MKNRVIFYIDGFNLYYGIRDRGPLRPSNHDHNKVCPTKTGKYKWLDLSRLCSLLMQNGNIVKIKYFTALLKGDIDKISRQENYLQLLSTFNNIEIIKGNFLCSQVTMRYYAEPHNWVKVIKNEEKGTDVNIASHMLIDGFHNEYDIAALISNDSDFAYVVKFIKEELKKGVIIFNPQHKPSKTLSDLTMVNSIFDNTLKNAQFPSIINGFARPDKWK